MRKLQPSQISVGIGSHYPTHRNNRAIVLGHQFGPTLLVVTDLLQEAIDEWDERHGERVNPDTDADILSDYGPTTEEAIEAAMNCGDIRINDGGTMVWVDHYEWAREFQSISEAADFFRNS